MNKATNANGPHDTVPNPMENGLYRSIPLAAVILGFAVIAMLWTEIPMFLDTKGQEGGSASFKGLLWILPVINLLLFYALGSLPKYNLDKFNSSVPTTKENKVARRKIGLGLVAQLRLVICILIAYLSYAAALSASSGVEKFDVRVLIGLIALLFLVIGVGFFRSVQAK